MRLYEFNPGSDKPLLHLAHANGFLPPTYRECLNPLLKDFRAIAFAPRPLWGGTKPEDLTSWDQMAGDLIESLDGIGAKGIIGIGHSLGGVLTLYAAVRRPDLFRRVILIDPTMLSPRFIWKVRLLKLFGREARAYLVEGALRRKREWKDAREVYDYFRGRQLFKSWSDDMVGAYSESITAPLPKGGMGLIYPPEWEARIYRTIPTDVWSFAKRLAQPALVIRGELSNTFTEGAQRAFQESKPDAQFRVVAGAGHLLPQESPSEVAKWMMDFLKGTEGGGRTHGPDPSL